MPSDPRGTGTLHRNMLKFARNFQERESDLIVRCAGRQAIGCTGQEIGWLAKNWLAAPIAWAEPARPPEGSEQDW